jgi:hypothetical protein
MSETWVELMSPEAKAAWEPAGQLDLVGGGVVGHVAAMPDPGGGREGAVHLVGVGAVEDLHGARRLGLQAVDGPVQRLQTRAEPGAGMKAKVLRLEAVDDLCHGDHEIVL